MKTHTLRGAELFPNPTTLLERMASEIVLHHHQKWDGSGYPDGPAAKGKGIPLMARIVALADVYDALISTRCYKDAWPEEKVLDEIRSASGKHFDPEVVDAFLSVQPVIRAIRERYP
jgi:response regulator RpfG family c-di-GMP phosphodiesterase